MSGGTNKKISAQNKQVKKQYKYDKKFHKFQEDTNQANYEKAVADTELQQAQADARVKLQNQIKRQQFKYQQKLQNRQYNVDTKAYEQSLEDYDKQTELNSMSGALAREAADRAKTEALIKKQFDLKGQELNYKESKANIGFDKRATWDAFKTAKESKRIQDASLLSKEEFTKDQEALDQQEITEQQAYLGEASTKKGKRFELQKDKLDKDITYLDESDKIDVKSINLVYKKNQTANFNKRIASIIKREQELGKARASGREGLSADRARSNALADYGRSQAELVESLVFSADEQKYSLEKGTLTRDYRKELKSKDKDIIDKDKELEVLSKDREIGKLDISATKISNAMKETVAQLGFEKERAQNTFDTAKRARDLSIDRLDTKEKFLNKRNRLAKQQIRTTYDSAVAQHTADKNKIKLDEYAANLAAQGKVLPKPKKPIPIPVPYKTLKTKLPVPQKPFKAPKPIKGALGKTSIWNDVGDGLNAVLSIASIF